MTSHIIFSLPAGTDKTAAYRAMRKAAEDVFGATTIREGDRGNPHEFDYLTAFHTDKPHPHLHVLVNRKSLQRDPDTKKHEWLKIARRNTRINYAVMREKFAYRAQQEGIDVEATSRLERGIETPSLSNEQFRINARNAVEVREQWGDLTVIAVDPTSQSRSATPEPVAGPSTQRPQGAGSASGQTGGGTGGGGSSRPDIATDGNVGTHSRHHDHTPPALAVAAAAIASPSSTGAGIEPGNDTAQEETNAGSSDGGSESYSNVIDAQRSNEVGRQRREQIKSRQAVRVAEDAEDDHTRRRIPEPSILDKERSDEIERQQGERIARDRAAREVENAEGDRRRRRVSENSSLPSERDDAQSVATAQENASVRREDPSPSPASSNARSEAPDNQPIANEQFQFTFRVTQDDGGGGGTPENAAEPPQETAAQAAQRRAAARARKRGDDLDRVVRTRGQKEAEEQKRIEDGPVSGRLRNATRAPRDRTR
ncbi:relaxase/mobilization nuclease domain-containing protein [Agrobacterium tumefaciens]|nr:relaxase/mobilization nuclease domain-containing protein [Agrobacterium tumefaciens]MCW8059649.1 relaxase/mobilization nuclease domain-containing protein [Agrobacterium tumefaciens]